MQRAERDRGHRPFLAFSFCSPISGHAMTLSRIINIYIYPSLKKKQKLVNFCWSFDFIRTPDHGNFSFGALKCSSLSRLFCLTKHVV